VQGTDAPAPRSHYRRRGASHLRALRRARPRIGEGSVSVAERLLEKYREQVRPALQKRFNYTNVNQIPKLEKVVINMSVGEALVNPKALDAAVTELTAITGQKPIVTKAKKSIAAFKLRAGVNLGAKVTLRGDRMYVFVDKLFNVVLPRIRDFRGLPAKSFDGRGNYNLGLREQLVFPEVNFDKVDKARGMDVTIVTSAKTDEEASEFLVAMGLPLQKLGAAR
jgi:large subunit ribosomal protein L5